MHFGIALADRDAVLALRGRLARNGVELVEEWDEPDYISVKSPDPDGYIVERRGTHSADAGLRSTDASARAKGKRRARDRYRPAWRASVGRIRLRMEPWLKGTDGCDRGSDRRPRRGGHPRSRSPQHGQRLPTPLRRHAEPGRRPRARRVRSSGSDPRSNAGRSTEPPAIGAGKLLLLLPAVGALGPGLAGII